jgi:hypothetical protein
MDRGRPIGYFREHAQSCREAFKAAGYGEIPGQMVGKAVFSRRKRLLINSLCERRSENAVIWPV